MEQVSRNSACPCGSGLKYKRCCLTGDSQRTADEGLRTLETLDATGRNCRWTIFARTEPGGSVVGEFVEHACDAERFEVDRHRGWLRNGKQVSMFAVLDALPPQLNGWALRTALDATSDEDLTPIGMDVARVFLLVSAVNEVVREHAPAKLDRIRSLTRRRRAAA
jgi:SEC-C motif